MTVLKILFLFQVAFGLSEIKLRSLSDVSTQTVKLNSSKPNIFIVFGKDCSACHKQIKDLSCLKDNADILLVGSFADERSLRQEYKTFNSKYKAVYGDRNFRKIFNISDDLTPQIIIGAQNKYKLILGAVACNKLLQTLKEGF